MVNENHVFYWDREAIRKLLAIGVSVTRIAKECGKSRQAVYRLIARDKPPRPHESQGPADSRKGGG